MSFRPLPRESPLPRKRARRESPLPPQAPLRVHPVTRRPLHPLDSLTEDHLTPLVVTRVLRIKHKLDVLREKLNMELEKWSAESVKDLMDLYGTLSKMPRLTHHGEDLKKLIASVTKKLYDKSEKVEIDENEDEDFDAKFPEAVLMIAGLVHLVNELLSQIPLELSMSQDSDEYKPKSKRMQ